MRVTDVFLAVPQLILALALAQLMTPSLESAMLALTLTYWPFFTRIVYAETRRLKAALFVDALQCIGASGPRILFLHILPNCISPIIVRATIGMGFTILVAAVLGFLGMGATPPDPDWGLAISESRAVPARRLVVLDLPGPCHLPHRARLQPARRRPARHRRSAPEALAMSAAPVLEVRNLRLSVRTDEGAAQILDRVELALAARAHPRRRRRIRAAASRRWCGPFSASCRRRRRIESGEILFEGEDLLRLLGARAARARARPPHRLHPAGPVSGAQSGLQDRDAAAGGDALARAEAGRRPALRRRADAPPSRPPRRHPAAGADPRARGGARALSAPVLRRPAPAPDDRRRARLLARASSSPTSRRRRSTSRRSCRS